LKWEKAYHQSFEFDFHICIFFSLRVYPFLLETGILFLTRRPKAHYKSLFCPRVIFYQDLSERWENFFLFVICLLLKFSVQFSHIFSSCSSFQAKWILQSPSYSSFSVSPRSVSHLSTILFTFSTFGLFPEDVSWIFCHLQHLLFHPEITSPHKYLYSVHCCPSINLLNIM
jgi:hypothetical protein